MRRNEDMLTPRRLAAFSRLYESGFPEHAEFQRELGPLPSQPLDYYIIAPGEGPGISIIASHSNASK